MRYRVLALDPRAVQMSLPVLRRLRELVDAGAVVAGAKPVATPSLADDEREFRAIAAALWGDGSAGLHGYGKGRVYAGMALETVLQALAVAPDFEVTRSPADTELLFVHRRLADGELYFVNNRQDRAESPAATIPVRSLVYRWRSRTICAPAASPRRARRRSSKVGVRPTTPPWSSASPQRLALPSERRTSTSSPWARPTRTRRSVPR